MNIQTIVANPALAACWLSEAPREEVEAFADQISRRPGAIPAEGRAFLQDLRDRLRPSHKVEAAGPVGVPG